MISIVTVNYNAYDFLKLMIESLNIFSSIDYELIIVDNSLFENQEEMEEPNVLQLMMGHNLGHGWGLNYGTLKTNNYPYLMFLDVDCHILRRGWEQPFLDQMDHFDIVGGRGVPEKPIRPACMFMKKEIGQKYSWEDTPDYKGHRMTPEGRDVAISAYYQMQDDKVKIGFLEAQRSRYGTLNGEEYMIDNKPLVYHHWHGASLHLPCRQADFPDHNLFADKDKLFKQIPWRLP